MVMEKHIMSIAFPDGTEVDTVLCSFCVKLQAPYYPGSCPHYPGWTGTVCPAFAETADI